MRERNQGRVRMTRRAALSAGLGAIAAPAIMKVATAQTGGAFNWKRFAGQSIEVSLTLGPRANVLKAHEKEFTDLTGIKVGSEVVPEQQHRQQVVIQFNSGNPQFDVLSVSWHVQKRLIGKAKWLIDMHPMLKDAQLTAPDYDFPDFTSGGLRWATQGDGRMDTLPLNIDPWMIYYNKEIFAAKGLAFPKSFDEIVMAAEKLTDKSAGVYGWVSRGLKNANVPVWTSFMLGYDVDPVNPKTVQLQTMSDGAIGAGEYYKKLNREFAPPGTVGFNWNEAQTSFSQGKIGMWIDGIGFAPPLEDPTKSRIVGKVGYALMPQGPKARHSATFGDGIGVPVASKKKEAAYLYCQWATSKVMCNRLLQSGGGSPCRASPYKDPQVIAGIKLPREWLSCLEGSAAMGRPGLPEIVPVTEFRDVFGIGLTNTIGGADVRAEMQKATEAFTPVLQKSEA
ncbi:MAG: extracellular solute-binding protein [Alphaproteobacteria bacterium]|nr:extracellular solute-binding protein [Alphaproteobacteria bacterium]